MEFNKNDLINKTLDSYLETWSHTLDAGNYVDEKYLKRIDKYIFKNLKKKFNDIEVFHLLYLRDKGYKLSLFQKLKILFSGLEPLYYVDKKNRKTKKC